jgi:serine/threonine-protein kinase
MLENHEAELRLALAEGLLSREEADQLREEAGRLERSPLELLRERGRLSEETLVSLREEVRESPPKPAAQSPTFPVTGWERYECVRFLGEGGMGRVFLAYDPRLRREVALKFVRGDDAELSRRFVSEARAQARVNHERVCKVYEVGEVQGRVYIAMQYVDGQSLSALAGTLTVEQKVMMIREAADGVQEAHRVGLVHRDLKPSNILVERTADGELKPYVMDFGLARDWNEGVTATGTVLGTPLYMAPEQARGEVARLDRRADVYSLGASLYHLLTGHPPIPGANALEVLTNLATVEPRPPRTLEPDLPVDLEAIVLKCLEKERSARYDSARALVEELDRFLGGEPVQARSPGRWYRLRKKARKHRTLVSVAAVALVLVAVALGWALRTRGEAAQRERLARRFTEQVERIEAMARYSALSPLHDTREDRKAIQAKMDELEAEIRQGGPSALGPGYYALGRGFLALEEEGRAREYLESAWRNGYQEPRVAYALALVMGHLYQEQLLEVALLRNAEQREARRQAIEQRYRDPALAYLKQSEGADVPSPRYVAALLAFYESRFEDALGHLDALGGGLPWFAEAPKLRGDILTTRASRAWSEGRREQALADFEAGRAAYLQAANIGRSMPSVHLAHGELEYSALVMELYGQGDVLPSFNRGREALSLALSAAPDNPKALLLESRLHRQLAAYRTYQGSSAEEPIQKALAAAQRAVALASEQPQFRLELALDWWQRGQILLALNQDPREALRKSAESFEGLGPESRNYEFHFQLGLVFKAWADYEGQVGADPLPNFAKAIEAYGTAARLNERLPAPWINLGNTYYERASSPRASDPEGDLRQAQAALDKALALNPKHVIACLTAARIHARAAERLSARGGDARPELAAALELYRRGLAINPKFPHLHNGLGASLLEQAKEAWAHGEDPFPLLASAREAFEQAIAVAPEHGFAYHNVSEVLAWRASYQSARGEDPSASVRAAVEILQKALERIPEHASPWANLGRVHALLAAFELEQGRDPRRSLARASEGLGRALERNPNHVEGWLHLGTTRAVEARWKARQRRARAEDFEGAAQAFQKVLELQPGSAEARLAFGHLCREWAAWLRETGGEPRPVLERGLALANQGLAERPGWAEGLLLRAGLRMEQAESREALEDFTRALVANPNLEPAWRNQALRAQRLAATSP